VDLLRARIRRFVSGLQSELTRDLVNDMRMLMLQQQRTPVVKAIKKKRKAKKSGGKTKKQVRDEL
jgi:hypothetical protein